MSVVIGADLLDGRLCLILQLKKFGVGKNLGASITGPDDFGRRIQMIGDGLLRKNEQRGELFAQLFAA